jgi:beta-lactam-binding protein with PASTA domain
LGHCSRKLAAPGKQLATAKRALKRRHCRTGKVRYADSGRPKGVVVAQSRRPGRVLPADAKIDLIVSRGRRR